MDDNPIDGNGILLNKGDKVFAFDIDGSKQKGILIKGKTCRGEDDWYVHYEDGEDCLVIEFSTLWKI